MAWAPSTRSSRWVAKTVEAGKSAGPSSFCTSRSGTRDLEKNGWAAVEPRFLAGRKHNVFCGHVHRYQVFHRNGTEYYQLATTGGGALRGTDYGEFDHVAWITMKKDKPLIANVMLDGILPSDLRTPESEEKGVVVEGADASGRGPAPSRRQAAGRRDGHLPPLQRDHERYNSVCNGKTNEMGRFQMSTYRGFDGGGRPATST